MYFNRCLKISRVLNWFPTKHYLLIIIIIDIKTHLNHHKIYIFFPQWDTYNDSFKNEYVFFMISIMICTC